VDDTPLGFLPRRWTKHVLGKAPGGSLTISRPAYELAVLTTLNEPLKSDDVTLRGSRRWTDFDDYLIPAPERDADRATHYRALALPLMVDEFLAQLQGRLDAVTREVDGRVPGNPTLTIDPAQQRFRLTALPLLEFEPALQP
jgi:hypothetical protein